MEIQKLKSKLNSILLMTIYLSQYSLILQYGLIGKIQGVGSNTTSDIFDKNKKKKKTIYFGVFVPEKCLSINRE